MITPVASSSPISTPADRSLSRTRNDSASSPNGSSVRVTAMVAVVVWAAMVSVAEAAV